MKKILIICLCGLFLMQACKKDQKLIDNEKPEERASKELQKFNDELIQSPNGWVAHLHTTEIKGDYSFYINFKENNVLNIRADFDDSSLNTEQIGTYRLKKVMATTLIFDTDNYLHVLTDPESKKGGKTGIGFGSDTEFEIVEQTGDTLKLAGKRRKTKLILVKATTTDKDFYTAGGLSEIINYLKSNPYLYIPDENDVAKKIQISIGSDIKNRKVSFFASENNVLTSADQLFSFSTPGISNPPLTYGGRTFIGFEWDKTNKKLFAVSSKGDKIELLVSATPIIPLHLLTGTNYKTITVPNDTTYAGWGNDFVTRRAKASKLPYQLKLQTIQFDFDTDTKKVKLTVGVPQGTTQFWALYVYDYTKTDTGVYKFNVDSSFKDDIGDLIKKQMGPILAERLEVDTFTLDYFVDPTTKDVLAQFKSVEHPDFTFTGKF